MLVGAVLVVLLSRKSSRVISLSYPTRRSRQQSNIFVQNNPTFVTKDRQWIRYRCRVAYDGSGLNGFQYQGNPTKSHIRTVQGELEDVLQRRFHRPIRVVGASRTDSGVHARGQAVHFDLLQEESEKIQTKLLQSSLNRMLRKDIRIWNVQLAPLPSALHKAQPRRGLDDEADEEQNYAGDSSPIYEWNAMLNCHSKLYVYRFSTSPAMDPCLRHNRWQLDLAGDDDYHMLSPDRLRKTLQRYQGTHDFACFAGALERESKKKGYDLNTVRSIHSITLVEEGDDNYRIEIQLDGALYKMIRNVVGTAIDVCRGRVSLEYLDLLLNPDGQRNRHDNPCKPAPPQGLTLERAYYKNENDHDDDF